METAPYAIATNHLAGGGREKVLVFGDLVEPFGTEPIGLLQVEIAALVERRPFFVRRFPACSRR